MNHAFPQRNQNVKMFALAVAHGVSENHAEFVELPPQYSGLLYSNILCGVIRGALEMVQMKVSCRSVRDVLRGDDVNEIRCVHFCFRFFLL